MVKNSFHEAFIHIVKPISDIQAIAHYPSTTTRSWRAFIYKANLANDCSARAPGDLSDMTEVLCYFKIPILRVYKSIGWLFGF